MNLNAELPTGPEPERNELTFLPPTDQKAIEWITVLAAADVDYRLSMENSAWSILVPIDQAGVATAELDAFEASEAHRETWIRSASSLDFPFPPDLVSPAWVVVFISACHGILGAASARGRSFETGAADMERIASGEWWRAVTALTLHMDGGHLAGNLFGLAFLGYLACRIMGSGLGWLLILASGALGNTAEAVLYTTDPTSIGASTSVFGALGILVAHRTTQNFLNTSRDFGFRTRMWLPVGSGLAVLALWGSSPGSNIRAHFLGFVAGCLLAIPFSVVEADWMKGRVQTIMSITTISIIIGAWYLAGL